ncbi:hypothetical protein AOL_s00169g120 [Orbilia oligospora ATCC 24927]|uniref:Uncharacterized protein n=1 Tax=Arthrobotrys oligospora (strain ATCC 24927 / CBS 115.81 / DSM 1491) TaxID=756982 RepID=G1XMR7_ARTOA|nr:hypothetical protein AOL_s00169g120 [Orbilia oligospora ATCC 24927]EGX45514.1 hypothetical protein AOL_s00169g120 [Orbilia oligospora ATCC 24927]
MTRLARERFSLRQMSPTTFMSNIKCAYRFLYDSCHASGNRDAQLTTEMPFPDPCKLYDPDVIGELSPTHRIFKPHFTYQLSRLGPPDIWQYFEIVTFPQDDSLFLYTLHSVEIPKSIDASRQFWWIFLEVD